MPRSLLPECVGDPNALEKHGQTYVANRGSRRSNVEGWVFEKNDKMLFLDKNHKTLKFQK